MGLFSDSEVACLRSPEADIRYALGFSATDVMCVDIEWSYDLFES